MASFSSERLFAVLFGLLIMATPACHKSGDGSLVGTLTIGMGCSSLLINVNPHVTLQPENLSDFSSTVTLKAGQRVIFSYTPSADGSVCMDGPVVKLTSIRND